jgi:nucleotide-binding universal stress UspA family protein
MKILIGVTPDSSSHDAIALGAVFLRSFGGEVVLGNIFPAGADRAGKRKGDPEWVDYLRREAHEILNEAEPIAQRLGLTTYETAVHGHRSSGVGLSELADSIGADVIVIGSAPGGSEGRFVIGSTANQLLHGSQVPVACAPDRYRRHAPSQFATLVVGFRDSMESHSALEWARTRCGPDLGLTALNALVRHRMTFSRLTYDTPEVVADYEREDVREAMNTAVAALDRDAEAVIVEGQDALSALRRYDWRGDELFVLGSARVGGLPRVFLGDMTYKLVRATLVPVIVLPRQT